MKRPSLTLGQPGGCRKDSGNRRLALERMRSMGIAVTPTKMALFELMQAAGGEAFNEFIRIVK